VRRRLRVATRGSPLARLQAESVARRLGVDAELVLVTTTGDRDQRPDVHAIGGTGVFVKEVQEAVLDGRADLAVHSAKDLPSTTPNGLRLAAVPERADPRDALVGRTLDDLPTGATVGTGAVRRRAQLAAARPDLSFGPLRGNIATRLEKAASFDAVVVAVAALQRLGLAARVAEVLDPSIVLPQVGQGALAVECRDDDRDAAARLAAIDDPDAHAAVRAERAFLAGMGGGCDLPVGALATRAGERTWRLDGVLATLDGRVVLRARREGDDVEALGAAVVTALLEESGGDALLERT
jgi:hydroxymethylbilane synthase